MAPAEPAPVEIQIDGMAIGGRGIGRRDGLVWFVPGTVPGDTALVAPVRTRVRFVEGRLVRLLSASADRRTAPCGIQDRCGGCPLMPLPEETQASWRRRFVVDALERIGGFHAPPVEPVRNAPKPLGYRNRIELMFGAGPGESAVLGLHPRDPSDGLVDVERCLLLDERAGTVLSSLRSLLPAPSGGESHRVLIRRSEATGEIAVGLWDARAEFPEALTLAQSLVRAHPEISGVVRIRAREGRRASARGEVLAGRAWIDERVFGLRFRLPVTSFLQVSTAGAEVLADLVAELAAPGSASALDLYCGVGIHALRLVVRGIAGSATGVDADRAAIECGREVASHHGLAVRLLRSDVARFLAHERRPTELVVANPPRAGLGQVVSRALAQLGPQRIVIVSCEPTTLARDLRVLTGPGRYRLSRVVPVDLFPQTAHVETVSLLERA